MLKTTAAGFSPSTDDLTWAARISTLSFEGFQFVVVTRPMVMPSPSRAVASLAELLAPTTRMWTGLVTLAPVLQLAPGRQISRF